MRKIFPQGYGCLIYWDRGANEVRVAAVEKLGDRRDMVVGDKVAVLFYEESPSPKREKPSPKDPMDDENLEEQPPDEPPGNASRCS